MGLGKMTITISPGSGAQGMIISQEIWDEGKKEVYCRDMDRLVSAAERVTHGSIGLHNRCDRQNTKDWREETMRPDELNAKILEGLSGKAKEDFEAGLKALNMDNPADREALRESIRRSRPDFTPEQVEIFVKGY